MCFCALPQHTLGRTGLRLKMKKDFPVCERKNGEKNPIYLTIYVSLGVSYIQHKVGYPTVLAMKYQLLKQSGLPWFKMDDTS